MFHFKIISKNQLISTHSSIIGSFMKSFHLLTLMSVCMCVYIYIYIYIYKFLLNVFFHRRVYVHQCLLPKWDSMQIYINLLEGKGLNCIWIHQTKNLSVVCHLHLSLSHNTCPTSTHSQEKQTRFYIIILINILWIQKYKIDIKIHFFFV